MEILPHEISQLESKLLHICEEKVGKGATTTSTVNNAMEREAHCVRPTRWETDNVTVVSNGKKDVKDHAMSNHGEKNIECIKNWKHVTDLWVPPSTWAHKPGIIQGGYDAAYWDATIGGGENLKWHWMDN
ncbi:hypothetical protein E2562_013657 [Oryza meyeriana var. granulata]|uniref:Uncharacterized protein n=1 Tax=Oryza meyeriana var. granulata TaxID=110450 RepID=A0A6G1BK79_9ORYZ|nr:hypothetical protein E2562_013657 [Oryza meyeriana var. granulata]